MSEISNSLLLFLHESFQWPTAMATKLANFHGNVPADETFNGGHALAKDEGGGSCSLG